MIYLKNSGTKNRTLEINDEEYSIRAGEVEKIDVGEERVIKIGEGTRVSGYLPVVDDMMIVITDKGGDTKIYSIDPNNNKHEMIALHENGKCNECNTNYIFFVITIIALVAVILLL